MLTRLRTMLARSRARYGEQLLTATTVILALVLFVFAPLQAANIIALEALGFAATLVLIVSTVAMSGNLTALGLMLFAFCLNGATVLKRTFDPSDADIALLASGWIIVAITLGVVVARDVFAPGRVSVHRIVGAVALYLLIGVTFAGLYAIAGILIPNAFAGLVLADDSALASRVIYFSFVTLTSVGYGDFVPVHPVVRSLCNVEAIIGQLYPATLLARLVSLQLAAPPRTPETCSTVPSPEFPGILVTDGINLNGRLHEVATIWSRTILPRAFTRV